MGLRTTVRTRAKQTWERILHRLSLSGPVEERWGRTPAWPPKAMGEPEAARAPALHPLDRVMAGLPTLPPAERSTAPVSQIEPDPPPAAPAAPTSAIDDFGANFPWGSVAQPMHLPEPTPEDRAVPPPTQASPEPAEASAPKELPPIGEPASDEERSTLRDGVVEVLQTIYDPEIPVDIYALGLIYDVDVKESRDVEIRMTLTSPNCPAAQSLPGEVEVKSAGVQGVRSAMVDIVWDPPWGPERMSEEAKLELNIDY